MQLDGPGSRVPWSNETRDPGLGTRDSMARAKERQVYKDFGELVGEGDYEIYRHDGHSHLSFELDGAVPEISLPRRGSFIVTVMNPDVTVWQGEPHPFQEDLFELERPIPTPFPPELQTRFGDRRYSQLDTAEFLDYPGAELVLIAE